VEDGASRDGTGDDGTGKGTTPQVFRNGERVMENGAGREVEVRQALRRGGVWKGGEQLGWAAISISGILDERRSALRDLGRAAIGVAGSWTGGDRRQRELAWAAAWMAGGAVAADTGGVWGFLTERVSG
jgi:hypothetical protein